MNLHSFAPRALAAAFGLALCSLGHASTVSASGQFLADNSFSESTFSVAGASNFSAATTSYATGGFIPVFTLFNDTTGMVIDSNGSAESEATLSDLLSAGTYDLFLTEFPNVANGNLGDGFLFAGVPNITGQLEGGTGMFVDDITGQQRTANFAYTASTTAVTPEPSSLLLMLPGAAAVMYSVRRRLV